MTTTTTPKDRTTMAMFPLSLEAIEAIATLKNATPADKLTREQAPILTGINLTITPAEWTAHATDRYVAAELTAPLGDVAHTVPDHTDPAEPITVPMSVILLDADVVEIARRAKAALKGYARDVALINLTFDDQLLIYSVTIANGESDNLGTFKTLAGNYPPVSRLIPTDPNGEVGVTAIDAERLARLGKIRAPKETSHGAARRRDGYALQIRFSAPVNPDRADKGAPMLITRNGRDNDGQGFRAILQPNIVQDAA